MVLTEGSCRNGENDFNHQHHHHHQHHHCGGSVTNKKGNRKRKWWLSSSYETEKTSVYTMMCPKNHREKFPYYHFLLGARLLHSKWREPRTHLSAVDRPRSSATTALFLWFHNFLSHIFCYSPTTTTTFNLSYVRYFFILFLCFNCLSSPSVSAATQDFTPAPAGPDYSEYSNNITVYILYK
jgi:hypothetical protein